MSKDISGASRSAATEREGPTRISGQEISRQEISRPEGLLTVRIRRLSALALATLGLAAASAGQDRQDRQDRQDGQDRQDRAPDDQLQSGVASNRTSAAMRLPAPAATSPSGAELRRMSREDRVRALKARSWEMHAERVREPIEMDGWLDEAAWERARPIGDFYEGETDEGLPSTEKTIVRVVYDDENLYFGFFCTLGDHANEGHASPHANRVAEDARPRTMFRDENIGSDDAVAIMLDAYNDQRSAIFLATNANGILFDMSQNGQGSRTRNLNWDMVWESRGQTVPGGWTAEVRIPFKSLRFRRPLPGQPVVFGVGFKRNIPAKTEEVYWPFVSNDSTWYRPAELGKLHGLEGIQPGRNVEVRPYAIGQVNGGGEWTGERGRADGGLDVKWGVTPGLTADFTWNTDFAQEEVDDLQINFTRFSLRFPEKRQIFLEGQRNFTFGEQRDADILFTRRIGLSDDGQAVPILGGGRLSGRQGDYTVGLMGMATAETGNQVGERFTVARVRRDIFSRSAIGAVFTDRSSDGAFNRVAGVDTNLHFRDAWSFEGVWARVFEETEQQSTGLASGKLIYEDDLLGGTVKFIQIGENFNPGIGFVQRTGMRKTFLQGRISPRPNVPLVRQVHMEATLNNTRNLENVLETRDASLSGRATFESGDEVSFELTDQFEFTTYDYSIGGVMIPAGEYPFRRAQVSLNTYRRRYASVRASYEFGGFWGGTRNLWTIGGNYRINKNFGLRGNYAYNRIRLPGGDLDTHLVSTRMQVAFRNDLILLGLFQYNNATGDLASNIRFNWIPKPGTDFFLVYTELDEWSDLFFVRNRSLSVKLNYLFRI